MQDYMVQCLNSIFSQDCRIEPNGQLSIISIYSRIIVPDIPATIPLCFTCFFELSLEKYKQSDVKELEVRILVNAPWGANFSDIRRNLPFTQISDKTARSNFAIPFGKMDFLDYGKYEFQVFINNRLIHTNFLEIIEEEKTTNP